MSEQAVDPSVVEIVPKHLSNAQWVMIPDPSRPDLADDVRLAVRRTEERARAELVGYCREWGYALRDVRTEWRFTISATGYQKPGGPQFEQLSLEDFGALVQAARPTPVETIIVHDLEALAEALKDETVIDASKEADRG